MMWAPGRSVCGLAFAIEVGLATVAHSFVGEICPALDGYAARGYTGSGAFSSLATAHLGALLFQNGLAREANAIAFNGQHFDQHLIAFFQYIAYVCNAVLGNFADVQQTISAGKN